MEEVNFKEIAVSTKNPGNALEVDRATFAWARVESSKSLSSSRMFAPVLRNVEFNVVKGKIVAICGNIGSGKSSLLSSLTGQLKLLGGSVAIQGRVGYVRQEAWIFHGTVRENILFGSSYDDSRYRATIANCYLAKDLKTFPQGDETLIGDRGLNLSDGQKQRIGLARAVYEDPDVLLLDDPLRAVDPVVCQFLFNNCLKKASTRGKTVLFNTNNFQYVAQCDEVILLKKGEIVTMGTHSSLLKTSLDYKRLQEKFRSTVLFREDDIGWSMTDLSWREALPLKKVSSVVMDLPDLKEVSEEEEEYLPSKSVTWSTYSAYLAAVGGRTMCLSVASAFVLASFSIFLNDFWLSNYLKSCDDKIDPNPFECRPMSLEVFLVVYVLCAVASILVFALRGCLFVKAFMRASSVIHGRILTKLLRTSMSFFDDMPPGKVLSTISSGMDGIDVRLPLQIEHLLENLSSVLICVLTVTLTFPAFLAFMALMAIMVFFLQRVTRLVNRQLKIAESLTKSPLYGHVVSTTQGLETIHAFKKMGDYRLKFESLVDNHISCIMMLASYNRWLGFRLEMLATVFTSVTAFLVVMTKEQIQVSFAGLAIVYASQLNRLLRNTIRYIADTEARFTSVERIESFIKNTHEEAPHVIAKNRPPGNWPYRGHIHFENFSMKYGPHHPNVLSNITCDIQPEEKVGIIGTTGSGKTSLTAALFRMVDYTEGTITIDGLDISTIGLHDLRSRLSIVPQDPILFLGTLRYNLDPLGLYTDEELWKSLEICFMKRRVMKLPHGLDTQVMEKGSNFSTGERQLFCLSRAFLKHSKIMILDEVTSSADTRTDDSIQDTIERQFADCTILTIAHKTESVLKCNRVMIVEDGKIIDYDTPGNLLRDKYRTLGSIKL